MPGGVDMPGYPKDAAEGINAIRRMNAENGAMPENAPDKFLAVGKKATAADRPGWATSRDEERPLSMKDGQAYQRAIEENKNNPDPKVQAKVQELREILSRHGWY
jgi:hypothetical protein